MLQSRCRAAALASFEAFTERNNKKAEPEKNMDLLKADAYEKILTFEKTVELTENHLSNFERKVQSGIQLLTKTLGRHNDLAQQRKKIQKYQKDQLVKLQKSLRETFIIGIIPEFIANKVTAVKNCLKHDNKTSGLIVLPVYCDHLQKDSASSETTSMKELRALLAGNSELLTRSKDMFIDYSSIPSTKLYLLLKKELQRHQKTDIYNLKSTVDYLPKSNIEEKKKLKRKISLKSIISDTSKRVQIDKRGYYMPAGLIS